MKSIFDLQRFANLSYSKSNTVINGTAYDDTIKNIYIGGGDNVTINAGGGNDSVYNDWGWYLKIDAGDGDDTITDYKGGYSSIYGGAGNDIISLRSMSDVDTIRGGAGNDTIYGDTVNLYGAVYQYVYGDGYDVIKNYKSSDTISIGGSTSYSTLKSGNDVVVTIIGSGAMTLSGASGKTVHIIGGTYVNTTIPINTTNYTKNTTINGGSLADTIRNHAGGVKIFSGAGNDYIYNSTSSDYTINNSWGYVTIDAGEGNDTIYSNDPYVSIYGGAGNDSIYLNDWSRMTVNGGKGNDIISMSSLHSSGVLFQYNYGDGYDTIYGANSKDTLSIGVSYSSSRSGNDLIYTMSNGSGAIYLKDYYGGSGISISSSKSNTVLNGTAYNDTIKNIYSGGGDTVTIYAGAGDDSIYNDWGWYLKVDAGEGNDTITDYLGKYNSINAGAGNDIISLRAGGGFETIRGGYGNDVIYGDTVNNYGVVYQYITGDGYDTIYNFKSSDTLSISGNSTSVQSGNDLIVYVGSGSITLKNYKPPTLNPFT